MLNGINDCAGGAAGLAAMPTRTSTKATYVHQLHLGTRKPWTAGSGRQADQSRDAVWAPATLAANGALPCTTWAKTPVAWPSRTEWEKQGPVIAWFKYYVRPLHTEFAGSVLPQREAFCIPEINPCVETSTRRRATTAVLQCVRCRRCGRMKPATPDGGPLGDRYPMGIPLPILTIRPINNRAEFLDRLVW